MGQGTFWVLAGAGNVLRHQELGAGCDSLLLLQPFGIGLQTSTHFSLLLCISVSYSASVWNWTCQFQGILQFQILHLLVSLEKNWPSLLKVISASIRKTKKYVYVWHLKYVFSLLYVLPQCKYYLWFQVKFFCFEGRLTNGMKGKKWARSWRWIVE